MRALIYSDWETLELGERDRPDPVSGEVLLRVAACGICGSELEAVRYRSPRRTPPLVLGHEFCGTIESVGDGVEGLSPGDRVVSHSLVSCGRCVRCRRGDIHLCGQREIFGMNRLGAFTEYVNVPARSLIRWPDGLPAEAACLAEPLANGVHVTNLIRHRAPETALVIGAGPIGLFAQQCLQVMTGARTVVADLIPERLDVALRLGAERVVQPNKEDVAAVCKAMTDGEGVDVVIDAVGAAVTKRASLDACRPGGGVVWIGIHENPLTFDSYAVTLPERTVYGSYAANLEELKLAVALMERGNVDALSWPTAFPLDDGVEAFRRMLTPQGPDVKAVLIP